SAANHTWLGVFAERTNQTVHRHRFGQRAGALGKPGSLQDGLDPELMPNLVPRMDRAGLARFFHRDPVRFDYNRESGYEAPFLSLAGLRAQLLDLGRRMGQ